MCILIVPQQNTGFILDSDMEGKNEESYKFPIADVRGDPDSSIGGLQIQAPFHHDIPLMDILPRKST
ncbi:hypothetical protein Tco_0559218, partial [Tanacetum coccineum]